MPCTKHSQTIFLLQLFSSFHKYGSFINSIYATLIQKNNIFLYSFHYNYYYLNYTEQFFSLDPSFCNWFPFLTKWFFYSFDALSNINYRSHRATLNCSWNIAFNFISGIQLLTWELYISFSFFDVKNIKTKEFRLFRI